MMGTIGLKSPSIRYPIKITENGVSGGNRTKDSTSTTIKRTLIGGAIELKTLTIKSNTLWYQGAIELKTLD